MTKKRNNRNKNKLVKLYAFGGPMGGLPTQGIDINKIGPLGSGGLAGSTGMQPFKAPSKSPLNASKALGAVGALGTIVGAGMSNAELADTSELESDIDSAKTSKVNSNNLNDLMSEWNTFSPLEHVSWKDVRGGNDMQRVVGTLGSTASGAQAGSQLGGPIGAAIGGGLGILGGITGWLSGNSKAKRKAAELNQQIDISNNKNQLALEDKADNIMKQSKYAQMANYSAYGGKIDINQNNPEYDNGVEVFNEGSTHEMNPNQGIQMGTDAQGIPNLVEEGEVKYNDYIFSNRIKTPKEGMSFFNLPDNLKDKSFSEAATIISKESKERPNDPISKNGLETNMRRLQQTQELFKPDEPQGEQFANGGPLNNKPSFEDYYSTIPKSKNDTTSYNLRRAYELAPYSEMEQFAKNPEAHLRSVYENPKTGEYEFMKSKNHPTLQKELDWYNSKDPEAIEFKSKYNLDTSGEYYKYKPKKKFAGGGFLENMRYAPIVGSGINVLTDMFGKTNTSDYANANRVGNLSENLTTVSAPSISNYMEYTPMDKNFYLNKLNANAGATRRAIRNQAGGNRATATAGLLAADYNYGNQLGDLARKTEEFNLAQKQKVAGFNRGTNQFNAQMEMQAALANKRNDDARIRLGLTEAQMRNAEDVRTSTARSSNLTNFLDNLSGLGIETSNRNQLKQLAKEGIFGNLSPERKAMLGIDDSIKPRRRKRNKKK